MLVKSIVMNKGSEVFSVSSEQTIADALNLFGERKIGFAVVRDQSGILVGTLSERDVCQALRMYKGTGLEKRVGSVMTENIVTCSLDDPLPKVMALMTGRRTRHLLIMENSQLVGLVSIGDVVKARLDEALEDEVSLRRYIEGTGYSYQAKALDG